MATRFVFTTQCRRHQTTKQTNKEKKQLSFCCVYVCERVLFSASYLHTHIAFFFPSHWFVFVFVQEILMRHSTSRIAYSTVDTSDPKLFCYVALPRSSKIALCHVFRTKSAKKVGVCVCVCEGQERFDDSLLPFCTRLFFVCCLSVCVSVCVCVCVLFFAAHTLTASQCSPPLPFSSFPSRNRCNLRTPPRRRLSPFLQFCHGAVGYRATS